MPIIGLSIVIQILCAVHCVRNGRNNPWLMVIIFLSIPGCLAYAFFEILPQLAGHREIRSAKAAALRKLDPQRKIRVARDALELANTAANRIALADALTENGDLTEASTHYSAALAKSKGTDRATQLKLARVELDSGNAEAARTHLESLPQSGSPSENDRASLLLARALQECGEKERAVAIFADVGRRLPGGEAQCRQAALLMELRRHREAELILADVEKLVKRLDRFERRQHRDMYDWAARTLSELRDVNSGSVRSF